MDLRLRPELTGLTVADAPERWEALGFAVAADGACRLGGVEIRLGGPGTGITGWTLRHVPASVELDGLVTTVAVPGPPGSPEPAEVDHPNGAIGIDHVVITTGDFDRTVLAMASAGLTLRRIREAGGHRQGFRRLGPAIMEIVEVKGQAGPPADEAGQAGAARFWGLVVVVADLLGLAERLGEQLGEIRPAVQPGRRIATLAASAGLSPAVAFMDAEGESDSEGAGDDAALGTGSGKSKAVRP